MKTPELKGLSFLAALVVFAGFALLAAFVYAYPAIFEELNATRPEFYRSRVEEALSDGDVVRAVKIAREAAHWRPLDPMAHTMLGRALMGRGDLDGGRAALHDAIHVPTTDGPEYRPTHRPFFFAPARLSLAQIAFESHDAERALEHLALANVYADLRQPEFVPFDNLMTAVSTQFGVSIERLGPNWIAISQMPPGSTATPGWIDVARDWYGIRDDAAARIDRDGERVVLTVTNDDIHKMALFYSVPLVADPDTACTLECEVLTLETPAVLGWQALDEEERIIDEGWLFDQETTAQWESRSVRIPPNYFYKEFRAVLGVTRHEGEAQFSNVRLRRGPP